MMEKESGREASPDEMLEAFISLIGKPLHTKTEPLRVYVPLSRDSFEEE